MDTGDAGTDEGPRIGFRRHLRAEVVPGEAVYLLSARRVIALHGPHVPALARLLDGTRTLPRLLRDAAREVPAEDARRALDELDRAGLIGRVDTGAAAGATPRAHDNALAAQAYWELAGLDGPGTEATVSGSPVDLVTVGRADLAEARSACGAAGLLVAGEDTGPAALGLVLCDDYLDPGLARIDAEHRALGRPWLLADPYGVEVRVGPVFRPDGPCWSCLAQRLRLHRRAEEPLRNALGLSGPVARPATSLPATRLLGLHRAALEAVKWLAGVRGPDQSAVCVVDTLTQRSTHHPLSRRPQCPACGDDGLVAARAWQPVVPRSRAKADHRGGDRALSSAQMLAAHGHLVSGVTGVVSDLRRPPSLPDGVHAYLSGWNPAFAPRTLSQLRGGLRSMSGGKGLTDTDARVSALCEAVERYSATRQGDEAVRLDTYAALGDEAVHPDDIQLFADWQFRERDEWNAAHGAFHQVPLPFDEHEPVEWTPVWSLTHRRHRLLPTSMLYFDACPDGPPGALVADSNGQAAGSSPEDALLQGFYELVERDAVALWWYNRTRHPAVDLDAFGEPWLAALRGTYRALGRELWALDVTSDLGIPVVAAVSRRTDRADGADRADGTGRAAEDILLGFGAHPDPRVALRRAVTELGQFLPAVPGPETAGGRYAAGVPADLATWWSEATVVGHPYLRPDPAAPPTLPGTHPYRRRDDLRADVEAVEELVRERGMELLVLDQTRPDVGIPVMKVIVPGLRHFWARLGPGRLYDVPVALGRLGRPRRRDELNPVSLFL
ncbi:TOMM precursor leader peptide-binding protein [Streptomyces uncialis]|uniref:TOMM precursor leader peptide-binding protein n=1 Tax=Streptomyces uncialis TaxID=1048205 RepID=UPI0038704ACB|nr:TOMM precursor leader peptide-binding protein [Streptomyces uncialis]